MTAEDRREPRLEQIVEVYEPCDEPDPPAPSPIRTLGASGVVVAVVSTIALGAHALAASILLVALAVALLTSGDGRHWDGHDTAEWSRLGTRRLDDVRSRLEELRPGSGSGSR